MKLTKYSGYYLNIGDNNIFIKTVKYYIKDKAVRDIMLRLNMLNIDESGIKEFKGLLKKAMLYSGENELYRLKIRNEPTRTLDKVLIINLDSFSFGGGSNE